jgi:hypothetical protein
MILILYLICLCWYIAQTTLILSLNNPQLIIEQNTAALNFLRNITADEHLCYHCINGHVNRDELKKKIIDNFDTSIKLGNKLLFFRLTFIASGLYNVSVLFLVFGDPVIINIASLLSSICLTIALFVENIYGLVFLESVVIIVSTLIMFIASHPIHVNIIQILNTKPLKSQ